MALFFVVSGACAPTFAPPPRVAIGALPELDPVGSGQARLHGGHQGSFALRTEGGLFQDTSLEMGLSGSMAQDGMVMAGVGLRRSFYRKPAVSVVGSGGVALGCGGKREGAGGCDSRFAWGTYLGLDMGYRMLPWLGLYQGSRVQWSLGDRGGPLTLWQIYALGLQVDYRFLFLSGEVGYVRYDSFAHLRGDTLDSEAGPSWSFALGWRW